MGILVLFFCVSCGQSVKETVKPANPGAAGGQFKRVAIVPFADHTPASSFQDHCRRNVLVLEALQDAFYRAGFISAAEEDVVQYLMDRGVIQGSDKEPGLSRIAALQQEMGEGWSDEMKEELQDVIYQEVTSSKYSETRTQKPIALSGEILKDLGSTFGADYIVRGRIVEYRSDQIDSFNPLRTGIIPFVFKSGQRTILGIAESEGYEKVDQDAIEDYDRIRNLFWGAGRFVSGLIGEKQGQVPGATVQIRVMVQDAGTGEVVWLNRAEACALPRTVFSDPDAVLLFAKSIEQAANSLVQDFADALASGRVSVRAEKKPTGPAESGEAKTEPFAVEAAAEKAERSALEAKESAQEAKDAAGEAKVFAKNAEDAAAEAGDAVKKASESTKKSEKIFEKIIAK